MVRYVQPPSVRTTSGAQMRSGKSFTLREIVVLSVLAGVLIVLTIVSLGTGVYAMSPAKVVQTVIDFINAKPSEDIQAQAVLTVIRGPRIVLAALTGAALAASGAAYQGMFRNPMVSPDILGVSAGASVGAAVALLLSFPSVLVHGLSFAFGLITVALVLAIARLFGRGNNSLVIIILAGVVMSSVFQAFVSLIKYVADPDTKLPEITYWLMGSFARSGNATNVLYLFVVVLVAGAILIAMRWRINALSFGEEEAQTLGIDVRHTRLVVICAATLLTSATVCLCGTIGWVGLIIPHITRLTVGPNYKSLLPVSMLGGAVFMLFVDDVARVLVPGELPVGILTSLIGAPLFIYMLLKGRKEWL